MAGTRLRGGSRSLARSGFTRHEKYNVGAAVRGKEELSPTACPAASVSHFMRPPVKRSLNGHTKRSLIGPTSPAPRGAGEVGM